MAKGAEKKKTNLMLNTAQQQSQQYTNQYLNQTAPERTAARSGATDLYNTMASGFKNLANTQLPGLNYGPAPSSGGGGGGGGGGTAKKVTDPYAGISGRYSDFANSGGVNLANAQRAMGILGNVGATGGWSPADKAAQEKLIAGLTGFGETGGVNPADLARMRGAGVFDEFARTGGFSAGDVANIRARGGSVIPSIYANAAAEAGRMGRVTGQYNPAVQAQMRRQSAYDAQRAALDTELGISEQVRQGRQWGGQNISEAELNIQNLITANKLKGLTGAGDMRANLLNQIAQNQIGAATPLGQIDIAAQNLIQEGKQFGIRGLEGLADKKAAAARAAAGASSARRAQSIADQKWALQFQRSGQLAGLGGLGDLYTSTPAEVGYYDKMRQGAIGQNLEGTSAIAKDRMANNPQRDWIGTIAGLAGAGVGVASGFGLGAKKLPGMGGFGAAGRMPTSYGYG